MHGDARTRVRDGWLPALLLVIGATELATLRTPGWPWAVALEAVGAALLVFRRTHPLVAVPGSAAAVLLVPLTGTQMNEAAAPILFYVVGVFSLGRFATALPGASAVVAVLAMVFADYALVDPRDHDVTDVVFVLTLAVPPYVFGRIVRKLDEHGRQLVEQQEVIRRQAVQAERDRIARELHDVIAHSVSAMVVQTAAAQDLVRSAPDRAAALLETVAETGRAALAETGRLLHLVRDDADELGLRPAPGLADLPALVASLRDGGMRLDAELELPRPRSRPWRTSRPTGSCRRRSRTP